VIAMSRENDLEGVQDQGGKHGGQKGMPKPEPRPTARREPGRGHAPDQGIVRDERGQEPAAGQGAGSASQPNGSDPAISLAIPRIVVRDERREATRIG